LALIKQNKTNRECRQWFQNDLAQIEQIGETSDPYWDVTLRKLNAISDGLWFELSAFDLHSREIIITAERRTRLLPLVEKIVAKVPTIIEWRFIAL